MNRTRGFSLLEMVVAIAVFAVIATVGYASLSRVLDAQAHLELADERLRALQTAFTLLGQDLRYSGLRSVRNEFGDTEPAFFAQPFDPPAPGERLRLTASRIAPDLGGLAKPQRVAWRLVDGDLYRLTWDVLDRARDSEPRGRLVAHGVAEFEVRFLTLDTEGAVQPTLEWSGADQLPLGAEVLITLDNGHSYRRVYEISDAV